MKNIDPIPTPIYSFPPIANSQSRVLILGTMPGKESLKKHAYYAHPQNGFWKIMFALFELPYSTDYKLRKELLLRNRIALWDVLELCTRHTSLDSDIKKEQPNDLHEFFSSHPYITKIYFNGKGAAGYFRKYFPEIGLPNFVLPSTSPAHAIKWESKLDSWKSLINIADN